MSDEPRKRYDKWVLRNWKAALCIAVVAGVANLGLRMFLRSDLPAGTLDALKYIVGWLAVVFWFNAMIFGQVARRDQR